MNIKNALTTLALSLAASTLHAGGLMTNTNYHIAFDRMMARGASLDIDAAYSNPAGLAWTHEGWQLSFNWQMPTQNRDITTTFPLFTETDHTHTFKGEASAPFVPGLFATYRKDRLALGAMVGIVGSGGFVKYDDGVPMFTAPLMALLYSNGLQPGTYAIDAKMKGKQYIYGAQLSATYRLTDHVAAAVGLRANYYSGYYRGHVVADHQQLGNLVSLQLDCDQKGWGFNPFIGIDYHQGPLTLAAKYEFRAKLNIPNETNQLEASMGDNIVAMLMQQNPQALSTINTTLQDKLAPYQDGAKTRYDMPALLTLAVGYELTPQLRATVEYHFFDDKHAHMAADRQKALTHGTHEVLLGAEYDINRTFTVSLGGQRTDYGLSDDYQVHTSFACDSYSVGFGGAVNLSEKVRLNVSYFWTMYSDYEKQSAGLPSTPGQAGYYNTTMEGRDVFSRTNGVFGIGIDYRF